MILEPRLVFERGRYRWKYPHSLLRRNICNVDNGGIANDSPIGFEQGGIQNNFGPIPNSGLTTGVISGSSGVGWMLGPGIAELPWMFTPNNSPVLLAGFASNSVLACNFDIPYSIQLNRWSWTIAASAIAGSCAFAIYSSDGNTKLLDTGAITKTTDGTQIYLAGLLSQTVTLQPGNYWFAWTATGTVQGAGLVWSAANALHMPYNYAPDGTQATVVQMSNTATVGTFVTSGVPASWFVGKIISVGLLAAPFAAFSFKQFIIQSIAGNNITVNLATGANALQAANTTLFGNFIKYGQATNNSTGAGVMPATLGRISGTVTMQPFTGEIDLPLPCFSC